MHKSLSLRIDFLSYFTEIYKSYCKHSFFGKLSESKNLNFYFYNFLSYMRILGYKKIDSKPFGHNSGLILRYDFVYDLLSYIYNQNIPLIIHPSPAGYLLNEHVLNNLCKFSHIAFLNSRYEGVDSRVIQNFCVVEISIGDYILYDGDTAALVILNALTRHIFVKSNAKICESLDNNLLEHDQYACPVEYLGARVPDLLRSGHHSKINNWQLCNSILKTKCVRPDIYVKYNKKN